MLIKIEEITLLNCIFFLSMQVQDWKLFLGVFALVVIDIVILATFTFIEGFTVYPDGLTGLQARRVISREVPEITSGVSE